MTFRLLCILTLCRAVVETRRIKNDKLAQVLAEPDPRITSRTSISSDDTLSLSSLPSLSGEGDEEIAKAEHPSLMIEKIKRDEEEAENASNEKAIEVLRPIPDAVTRSPSSVSPAGTMGLSSSPPEGSNGEEEIAEAVILTFKDKNGAEADVTFEQTPLGIGYTPGKVPVIITVVAPNSSAESLGVRLGTQLVKVNGEDLRTADYATIIGALRAACVSLSKAKHPSPMIEKIKKDEEAKTKAMKDIMSHFVGEKTTYKALGRTFRCCCTRMNECHLTETNILFLGSQNGFKFGGCGKYLADSHSWNYWTRGNVASTSQGTCRIDLSNLTPKENGVFDFLIASLPQSRTHHTVQSDTVSASTTATHNVAVQNVSLPVDTASASTIIYSDSMPIDPVSASPAATYNVAVHNLSMPIDAASTSTIVHNHTV